MPNYNPSPETRFTSDVNVKGQKLLSFKLEEPYDSILRNMKGNRSAFIRQAVIELMIRKNLIPEHLLAELGIPDRQKDQNHPQ